MRNTVLWLLGSLASCLVLLIPELAQAQTGSITGVVSYEATGLRLPGVNVVLEGAGRGAATDLDGSYTITDVSPGRYTLVATLIGFRPYKTQVVVGLGADVVQNVVMEEDRLGLEEIVITGQAGGVERRRLSTSVEVITPRQIQMTPAMRIDELLQAQLPSAQVRFTSGQPGTASMIRSRGVVSAMNATTPVIYVDGVRVDNLNTRASLQVNTGGAQSSALPDIPLENVERIEFTKGGAATTLYGSDAANGVIQIITMEGLPGRRTLSFETELGAMFGTTDFLRFGRTADVLYEPGLVQRYRLSGTGGTEQVTYAFSGSMYDDNGFRLGNGQTQYGLRTNVAASPTLSTRYHGSFGLTSHTYTRDFNANSSWGALGNLEGGVFGALDTVSAARYGEIEQSLRQRVRLADIEGTTRRFQTAQQLDVELLQDLMAKFTAGVDYRASTEQAIASPDFLSQIGSNPNGSYINRTERVLLGLTLEGTISHQRDFGPVSTDTRLGGQVFRDDDRQSQITAQNIAQGTTSVGNAAEQDAADFERTVANYGLYALENVGFGNRFFIELGLRVDGNSAFGEEVGLVAYPKAGFAYTLTEEPWLRRALPRRWVSNLKLRASLGYAGNFPTPFANDRLVNANAYLGEVAYNFGNVGNPDLRPEKTRTWEAGADLGLFNDRLTVEVTYYDALTSDALFAVPFPLTAGRTTQLQNVGQILNRGWEIQSQLFLISGRRLDLRLSASLNTLYNEVVDNGGTTPFRIGGFSFLGQWVDEEQPIGYLRGSRPVFNPATAEVDEVRSDVYLGSPLPDVYGSLNASVTLFDRLRLFVLADYQWGAQGVATDDVLRYFRGVQDPGRFPRAGGEVPVLSQSGINYFDLAGAWVEDTDFLKVRLVSLSYTLPERWFRSAMGGLGVRGTEVGLRIINPFNFVSSSFDPEVTGTSAIGQDGVNVGVFGFATESPPRQVLFNLQVNF